MKSIHFYLTKQAGSTAGVDKPSDAEAAALVRIGVEPLDLAKRVDLPLDHLRLTATFSDWQDRLGLGQSQFTNRRLSATGRIK